MFTNFPCKTNHHITRVILRYLIKIYNSHFNLRINDLTKNIFTFCLLILIAGFI
jgi:hypothetical protein